MNYTTLKADLTEYSSSDAAEADLIHSKAFFEATKEQRDAALRKLKANYRQAVADKQAIEAEAAGQDVTGKVNERIGQFVDQNVGSVAGALTRALLPSSNAQLAIDAAMFLAPEIAGPVKGLEAAGFLGKLATRPLGRLAMREAIPTAAGAIGGATSGDPIGGAESGAMQGAFGELGSGLFRRGNRTIEADDFARLRSWLESTLPGVKLPNEAAFWREFRGGEALKRAQAQLDKVTSKLPNVSLPFPQGVDPDITYAAMKAQPAKFAGLTGATAYPQSRFTIKELTEFLDSVNEMGWDEHGSAVRGHVGQNARRAAHQVEGEIASAIDKVKPGAANDWYKAHGDVRFHHTLRNLLAAGTENGRINVPKLQELVSDTGIHGFKQDLLESAEPQFAEAFQRGISKVVHRGASEGEQDIAGQGPFKSIWLHMHSMPGASAQSIRFARHVGHVPFDLGRGRALSLLATLGPNRFYHGIEQLSMTPEVIPGSQKVAGEAPEVTATMPEPTIAPAGAVAGAAK